MLEKEVEIFKSLNSDHFVKVIGDKYSINSLYIILEYCVEGDLAHYILQNKLTEFQILDIFNQILQGYSLMAEKKLLHGDIRLEKILLKEDV